jgi:hypothetical protein
MLSRRELAVGIVGAALAPGAARAADAAPTAAETAELDSIMRVASVARSKEGRYLVTWPRLSATTSALGRDIRQQWAALLGDETTALANAGRPTSPPDLTGARAEDALAAIVQAAKGRRVVMLNEAHVASRHRAFMGRVARTLREEGFTHLAAETFSNAPMTVVSPVESLRAGAALSPSHGYYINDPVYAEAVREALAHGYQLVAYEQRADQMNVAETPQAGTPRREQAQAENLAAALKRWPEGRFLIHVGYGHLSKTPISGAGPMMAGRLKELTGIDPLSIIQDSTGSFAPHGPDSAATQAVLAKFQPKDSIAVFDAEGRALYARRSGCDLTVFHPPLPDVDGRPGWLAEAPGRRRVAVRLPKPAPGGYVLAQAIPADDPDPAIPADQYLLAQGAREATFHLRPGRYQVRLETPEGFTAMGEARA